MSHRDVATVGLGGPVGSGKTALVQRLVPRLDEAGYEVGVIANDIMTQADADRLRDSFEGLIPPELVAGVETGACPHTGIREDPSMNIAVIDEFTESHPELDVVLLESGGDNLAATFNPELADYFLFVISVAEGDDIPRKRGPGVTQADLLVVNKTDLAPTSTRTSTLCAVTPRRFGATRRPVSPTARPKRGSTKSQNTSNAECCSHDSRPRIV